jgi:two-component system, NtrC family, sensor kinase
MRVGVSAKVFLAYAVLLVALGVNSAFSITSLHSARQHVEAHRIVLEVDSEVQSASRWLAMVEARESPTGAGVLFVRALDNLAEGTKKLRTLLADQPESPRRGEFEQYLNQIVSQEKVTRGVNAAHQASYSIQAPGNEHRHEERKRAFQDQFQVLKNHLDLFSDKLRRDTVRVLEELTENQERAKRAAILLGLAGLLGAFGAALSLWRTLRPLQVLRLRARQLAGGDYGRRIGLRTRDEIGDLAREFDSMAHALDEREQKLIRSERLATVGRIAAQITHEIRNPLASIGLNAELIADELGATQQEARRQLGVISAEVDRLSEITESYLRFVRLPRLRLEREDPAAIVTSAMEFARAELAQAGIELHLEVAADLPDIAADENQLRQALLNLLRNAKEAMPTGGKMRVVLDAPDPGRICLSVSDTGAGIAPEHVARVFEPFFSTKAKGTGLGLALVQQILNEHGGRVEVKSDPAAGTTFLMTFPALPAGSAEVTPEATPAPTAAALALPRRS